MHCRRLFEPRRGGHVFCSSSCRHRYRGELRGGMAIDRAQIERLFGDDRDPEDLVRQDDWHPSPASGFVRLDTWDTVGTRRHWYRALVEEGLL